VTTLLSDIPKSGFKNHWNAGNGGEELTFSFIVLIPELLVLAPPFAQ